MELIIPKYKEIKYYSDEDIYNIKADVLYELASIVFLLRSHPNDCIVIPGIKNFKDFKDLFTIYVENLCITVNVTVCDINVPTGWKESLLHCIESSKRFIMIPLTIDYGNNNLHANFLLYDKVKNSMERFEPNGYMMGKESYKCLGENDDIIKNLFKSFFKNLKYYSPYNFCPFYGFQSYEVTSSKVFFEKEGSCVTWSMWYTHLRLSNPDIPRDKLINNTIYAFEKNKIDYTYFIISFSTLIQNIKNIIIKEYINMEQRINMIDSLINDTIKKEYLKVKLIDDDYIKEIMPRKRTTVQYRVTPLPKPKPKPKIKKVYDDYKSRKKIKKIKPDITELDLVPSRYVMNIY